MVHKFAVELNVQNEVGLSTKLAENGKALQQKKLAQLRLELEYLAEQRVCVESKLSAALAQLEGPHEDGEGETQVETAADCFA